MKQVFEQSRRLFHFSSVTYRCAVDRGMWKGVEGKVWSVKKVECYGWGIWCVECEVGIVECKVLGGKRECGL